MSREPTPLDGSDLDAALHAFGLSRDDAREARDPAFMSRVIAWRERMSELDETAEPGPVDPRLWHGIEAALDGAPDAQEVAPLSAAHSPAVLLPQERPRAPRHGLWQNVAAWRAASLALAAALILAIGFAALRPSPKPIMVAVLLTDTNRAAAVVDVYQDGRVDLVPLEAIAVPDDRILQVWTLWDRARGPVSLGLLDRARQTRLPVADLPRTVPEQLFEITLEPRSGSPTGRPTGPILMKGTTSPTL